MSKIQDKLDGEKKKKKRVSVVMPPVSMPSSFIARIALLASPINDDVMLIFSKDGIKATVVDVINSSTIWIDINVDGYDYDGDDVSVCVPIIRLEKSVKGAGKDDLSTISIGKGKMIVSTKGLNIRIPLYSDCHGAPDNAINVAGMLPSSLRMSVKDISRFVSAASGDKGHVAVSLSDGTIHIMMVNLDTGNEDIFLTVPSSTVSNVDIPDECDSMFGTDMLFPIFAAISKTSKYVTVHLGNSMPMYLNSNLDGFNINYVIAPRAPDSDE